jgi:hypothetical protein
MVTHSGHDLARFFRRAGAAIVTPAEQVAAKHLIEQIAGEAFDHRKGCHPVTIQTVSNDTDVEYDTMLKVADRFAEAATRLAETVRKFNGHQPDDAEEASKSD